MRISDWSSDVCSSDLIKVARAPGCRMAESGNLQCFPAQETMDLLRDAPLAEQARAQEGDIHADQACETDLKEEGTIVRHIVHLQGAVAERSEDSRVGTEGVSPCRTGLSQGHYK